MHGSNQILRNLLCSSLAIVLIASGRVRRAKKKVLNRNVVTAIYFHNPNERLFRRCAEWLTKNGYTFISEDDVVKVVRHGVNPPRGAVWLSFDDGFKALLHNVVPLSRQRKIPITVFIPSGIVDGHGLFPWLHQTATMNGGGTGSSLEDGVRDSVTAADVRAIARVPEVSIGSHTVGHTVTASLSEEQTRFELSESRRVLESWTGGAVKCFAYPEGRLNGGEGRFLAECGYELAATTEPTFVTTGSDPYFVPRFHVGDNIFFPEAICNMVGVWRPAINPVLQLLKVRGAFGRTFRRVLDTQYRTRRQPSV